jgi:hypothetical protein
VGKRVLLAGIAVFVAWEILDFVIHNVLLKSTYAATAELWRPEAEMKLGVMVVVVLIAAFCFSGIYGCLVSPKSPAAGLKLGLLYGIAVGVGMGYGMYSVVPIPYYLALSWFLATVVETVVAGLLVGLIIRE